MKHRRLGIDELDLTTVPRPLRAPLAAARGAGAEVTLTARGHYKIRCAVGNVLHASPNKAVAELNARRLAHQLGREGIT